MVHQYDYREKESAFSKRYGEVIENVTDPILRAAIQNELLGINNTSVVPSKNILSLNPNQSFIQEYEKQAIQKREKQAKAIARESFNEKGEKYASIWNNEDFRKIHDPIGKILKISFELISLKIFNYIY
jgi:hypothetical protein